MSGGAFRRLLEAEIIMWNGPTTENASIVKTGAHQHYIYTVFHGVTLEFPISAPGTWGELKPYFPGVDRKM